MPILSLWAHFSFYLFPQVNTNNKASESKQGMELTAQLTLHPAGWQLGAQLAGEPPPPLSDL